eukprot:3717595-Amphidinium_carterae.1
MWVVKRRKRFKALCLPFDCHASRHSHWVHMSGLEPEAGLKFLTAGAIWGLPTWLQHQRKFALSTFLPFGQEYKCVQDDGCRRCQKVGHSCMRRVVASSNVPFASGSR